MRNALPNKIRKRERGVVNLDKADGVGTHWVAYKKNGSEIYYFDSYGDLKPTKELERYLFSNEKNSHIFYNHDRYQKDSEINCGQLCLLFLMNK